MAEAETEGLQPRDLAADQQLVMTDLLSGLELRHSINPAVSDFTNAAAVPADEVLSILTNWHNAGLVFSKIPNDTYDQDGVETRFKLNWNGYLVMRGADGSGGLPLPPVDTLTSISPTTGARRTTVTITATGTNFEPNKSYISVPGADSVSTTTFVSNTELTADVLLPNKVQTLDVSVVDLTWGVETAPQPFSVT